ncbi:hypothetical protein Sjap_004539 [Stephania japonica]|uniref:non-specific serine/threonine protein kinase n=1 Tax=Stephania japonica TaxID=461633 RepID=A0AAP0K2P6_9MAGN
MRRGGLGEMRSVPRLGGVRGVPVLDSGVSDLLGWGPPRAVSLAAFLAVGEFARRSISCCVLPRCGLRVLGLGLGPKKIWDDVVRTYYRKRKGVRVGVASVFPVAKRRLLLHSETGEGNQIMSISMPSLPSDSFEADDHIFNDLIRKMNRLTGQIPVLEFGCRIFNQKIPIRGVCGDNIYFPSEALCKIEEVKNDSEEEATTNVCGRIEESVYPQVRNQNLLGIELDQNFPKSNVLEYQEPAPFLGMVESVPFQQESQIDWIQIDSSPQGANCRIDNDFKDVDVVEDTEEISSKDRCKLINSGNQIEGQQDLDDGIVPSFMENRTAKSGTQFPSPLAKHHSIMKRQKLSSGKLKRALCDSSLQTQLPLKSVENKPITPKKEKSKLEQNHTYIRDKLKASHNNNLLSKENIKDSASKNQPETKALPTFESFVIEEEEGSGTYFSASMQVDMGLFTKPGEKMMERPLPLNITVKLKQQYAFVFYSAGMVLESVYCIWFRRLTINGPHANAHMHHVNNELKMLERFGGRNFVIKYEGSFKSGNADCFVLEHVHHDRPEVLKREIDVFQLRWYGYCLFRALASLHKQGIVHRDVKPGNFLFSRNFNKGYLIDFNLAMDLNQKYNSTKLTIFNTLAISKMARSKEISMTKLKIAMSRLFHKLDEWMQVQSASQVATLNLNPSCSSSLNSNLADPSQATDTSCPSRTYLETINSPPVFDPPLTCRDDCNNDANPMILETVIEKEIERIYKVKMHRSKFDHVPLPSTKQVPQIKGRIALGSKYPELIKPGTVKHSTPSLEAKSMKKRIDRSHIKTHHDVGGRGLIQVSISRIQNGYLVSWSGAAISNDRKNPIHRRSRTVMNIKDITRFRGSEDMWEVAKLHDREMSFPMELFDTRSLPSTELEEWCKVNTKRPDFLQAIPRSLFDLVDKCLTVNPRLRISADDALGHDFFVPCHESLKKQRFLRQGQRLESTSAHFSSQGHAIEPLEMMS